ncbi:MAG: hypothetical protein A2V65_01965 [Deltaproteobacteria bacterium RBG_13_49_15]|nr:MAG: hypothetical protein A2V65_01965 [Deltaproteobacteria bacterium RBG_13_49_15]
MSYIDPLYPLFLATGFTVGFGHCIGMCGPIAVSFSLNLKGEKIFLPHLLYNTGRIITYMILGGFMGATGAFTIVAAYIGTLQKGAMIFTGVLITIMGLSMMGWIPWMRLLTNSGNPNNIISMGVKRLFRAKSPIAYFPIGLLLGLLPCGPVYTALLAAAGSGMKTSSMTQGIVSGTAIMMFFGIGTVPALFLVAKLADMGWLKKRELIYRVGAGLMMIVGLYFVFKGIRY